MGIKRIERKNISQTIRESRLRWLGHVERKTDEDVVIRTWKMEMIEHRKVARRHLPLRLPLRSSS